MATQSSYRPAVPPHQLRQPQTQPAPPQPAPQHKSRPPSGKNRSFSFRSDKSHKSHGSNVNKIDLHETSLEKEAKRLHTKADPTMAISEAEPGGHFPSTPTIDNNSANTTQLRLPRRGHRLSLHCATYSTRTCMATQLVSRCMNPSLSQTPS